MSELHGVDVASFQGLPGQWKGAAGRIAWAAVKLTELSSGGPYVNPDAAADWAWLKAQGKLRIAYLYGHPSVPAAETASFFLAELTKLGIEDGDGVALDLEEADGKTPAEVSAWAHEVLHALRIALGRLPLLYTYLSFAWDGNCAGLGRFPLWISDPSSPAGHPRVPRPWKTWAIHQYGVNSPIDRDLAAYSHAGEMMAVLGKPGSSVDPGGPDKPVRVPKVRKHRIRKAAHKARHAAATAGHAVKKEPVLTAGSLNAAVAALVAFWLPHLGIHATHAQKMAAIAIATAMASLGAALLSRPVRVSALTGAVATIATSATTYGLHLPLAYIGGTVPFASVVLALLLRTHVSPVAKPVVPPALAVSVAAPAPAVTEAIAGALGIPAAG